MNILNKMSKSFKEATSDVKSNDVEIDELLQFTQVDVPAEYIKIIREKTEIEIQVDGKKYIRIWGANGCIEMNTAYHIQKYIPDSLAIGDDECSNAVLYAYGHKGFGVYIVPLNDLGVGEMVLLLHLLKIFLLMKKG